jgi:hypothetical protein
MKTLVAAASLCVAACASAPAAPRLEPSQADWTEARRRLAELRASPPQPYVEQIRIAMREPRSRRVVVARGAVAVRPGDAMRMILLGPGGTTALDAWVTRDRWRFVVPALELRKRGDRSPPAEQGLPIAFFRWWFLAPFGGRLLDARVSEDSTLFILRDGASTVTLREARRGAERLVSGVRRESNVLERIEWIGAAGGGPHVGDHARYLHAPSGFAVEVLVDAMGTSEPDAAAFLDPDEQGVSL